MPLSRRRLLQSSAGLAGLMLPATLGAQAQGSRRRFLFVLAAGGWDPTFVFADLSGSARTWSPPGSAAVSYGDLTVVDGPGRPAVRGFFERWAERACVINGLEVRSVTHERCKQILMTGGTAGVRDDWALLLASARPDLRMPCVVASGPSFALDHGDLAVRVGRNGQLQQLLDGRAITELPTPRELPPAPAAAAVDHWLGERLARASALAGDAESKRLAEGYAAALTRGLSVQDLTLPEFGALADAPLFDAALPLIDLLEAGLTRCAVVEHKGLFDRGWDTHSEIERQAEHFEDLFDSLDGLVEELDARSGPSGGSLLDDTVVVVISEMGRAPALTPIGGKDHWTWTSAMLLGGGVRGGQTLGGYDEDFIGRGVDLSTGEPGSGGTLSAEHLGATLLALGDVDPGPHVTEGVEPLWAALG
ncbi:MAG: DUF1501 domain-containing protein [Alphaproteobacteria bacterium]|nr:DUF1501 domain-containing protein [Alphaproteobacteria bacterium]